MFTAAPLSFIADLFVSLCFNHLFGERSLFLHLPHKQVVTQPLRVRWRKFLSIFLILFLWSHDFVVAEVCFRSLSSWMMKFSVRIFSSVGPWRMEQCWLLLVALSQPPLYSSSCSKANFQTEEWGCFSFDDAGYTPEVAHQQNQKKKKKKPPQKKEGKEFTSKLSWFNSG